MNYPVNIIAGGSPEVVATGSQKHLLIRSATAAFQISFDGSSWKDSGKNESYTQSFERVYFRTSGVACNIVFSCDSNPIAAQDTAQSSASTVPQGNLNIPNGSAAGAAFAGSPACDANGFLTVTNAMLLKVPGVNAQGNRRQILILAVSANGAALQVLASPTTGFTSIAPGTTFPVVSDSDFYISGSGGNSLVTIGEFYLKNNG